MKTNIIAIASIIVLFSLGMSFAASSGGAVPASYTNATLSNVLLNASGFVSIKAAGGAPIYPGYILSVYLQSPTSYNYNAMSSDLSQASTVLLGNTEPGSAVNTGNYTLIELSSGTTVYIIDSTGVEIGVYKGNTFLGKVSFSRSTPYYNSVAAQMLASMANATLQYAAGETPSVPGYSTSVYLDNSSYGSTLAMFLKQAEAVMQGNTTTGSATNYSYSGHNEITVLLSNGAYVYINYATNGSSYSASADKGTASYGYVYLTAMTQSTTTTAVSTTTAYSTTTVPPPVNACGKVEKISVGQSIECDGVAATLSYISEQYQLPAADISIYYNGTLRNITTISVGHSGTFNFSGLSATVYIDNVFAGLYAYDRYDNMSLNVTSLPTT